jgi:glutathione S-transferase
MFAALNTVEPPILFLTQIDMQKGGADPALREAVAGRVKMRLASLSEGLEGRDYLEAERFTACDLLMTSVLRILRRTDMVAQMPVLEAYRLRCEARPAYQKALADQMANFAAHAPPA